MTNKERQKQLDKRKWIESEKEGYDKGGYMSYCDHCLWQDSWLNCTANQEDRVDNELCAKAYNRMYREKTK